MPDVDEHVLSVYEKALNDAIFSGETVEVRYVDERQMKRVKEFVHRTNYLERAVEIANEREGIINVPFESIVHVERSMD